MQINNRSQLLRKLYRRKSDTLVKYFNDVEALKAKLAADLAALEKRFYADMADIKEDIDLLTGVKHN